MARKTTTEGDEGIQTERLIAAARDMNTVMGLDPAIGTDDEGNDIIEDLPDEDLTAAIKNEADEVLAKDKLEDDTWAVLEELGVAEKAIAERNKKAPAKEEKVADKKKAAKDKKAPAKGKDKKAPAKEEKKAKAPKKESKPKEPKGPRYSRARAVADALGKVKKTFTVQELAEKADELYKDVTGGSNVKEALAVAKIAVGVLDQLGTIQAAEEKNTYTKA